jgi:plasmid stability protein
MPKTSATPRSRAAGKTTAGKTTAGKAGARRTASLTIRGLDAGVKARLRRRAAERGHSMEEEARQLLTRALAEPAEPETGLASAIHRLFAPLGGVELDLPPREPGREPPTFD